MSRKNRAFALVSRNCTQTPGQTNTSTTTTGNVNNG